MSGGFAHLHLTLRELDFTFYTKLKCIKLYRVPKGFINEVLAYGYYDIKRASEATPSPIDTIHPTTHLSAQPFGERSHHDACKSLFGTILCIIRCINPYVDAQ